MARNGGNGFCERRLDIGIAPTNHISVNRSRLAISFERKAAAIPPSLPKARGCSTALLKIHVPAADQNS